MKPKSQDPILFNILQSCIGLILIPILFTMLFGWIYSEIYVENIPLAICDQDHSETSREIIRKLEASPGLKLVAEVDSHAELRQMLLDGQIRAGVYLPPDLAQDIKTQKSPKVLAYVDGTNIVIGNNAYNYIAKVLLAVNQGIQMNYLQGEGLTTAQAQDTLEVLKLSERTLNNPQLGYFWYLFAALLGIFIQQTFMNIVSGYLIRLKARLLPTKQLWSEIIRYVLFCLGLSLVAFLTCILLANHYYGYPLRGSWQLVLILGLVFLLDMTAIAFMLGACFKKDVSSAQFTMLLSVPTFLTCAYNWPEFMMPEHFAPLLKAVWPLYYLANPLKDLLVKGNPDVQTYIYGGLIFALVWLPVSIFFYAWKSRKSQLALKDLG